MKTKILFVVIVVTGINKFCSPSEFLSNYQVLFSVSEFISKLQALVSAERDTDNIFAASTTIVDVSRIVFC